MGNNLNNAQAFNRKVEAIYANKIAKFETDAKGAVYNMLRKALKEVNDEMVAYIAQRYQTGAMVGSWTRENITGNWQSGYKIKVGFLGDNVPFYTLFQEYGTYDYHTPPSNGQLKVFGQATGEKEGKKGIRPMLAVAKANELLNQKIDDILDEINKSGRGNGSAKTFARFYVRAKRK